MYVSFFFFQAEDGIRDKLVTGVQTCALPIFLDLHAAVGEGHLGMAAGNGGVVNRDVAGHGAPDDDVTTRLQVDGLLARRAQQLEHRRQIYFTLRPWRAPTP